MWLNVSQYGRDSHGPIRDEESESVAGTPSSRFVCIERRDDDRRVKNGT